jgi:beta-galactosidase
MGIRKMKTILFALMFFVLSPVLKAEKSSDSIRINENFDFDWKFRLGDLKEASSPGLNDSDWRSVQLPHDWSVEMPFEKSMPRGASMGFMPGGIGWYRKSFVVPEELKGRNIFILFDGVYHQSDVYLNGRHLGFHPYGYIGFGYDLTPYIKPGQKNVIAVRVDHSNAPSSRWYSGSGIYRHVWLKVTNPVHIANWGTYVTTPKISKEAAEVKITTTIANSGTSDKNITLESEIFSDKGEVVAKTAFTTMMGSGMMIDCVQSVSVADPQLWSVRRPTLYRLVSSVKIEGQLTDRVETPFGIREVRYDPQKGFFLNGENIKMKGVNLHQDAGSLGTAVPDRSYERRLEILKEYGCNAIRCSHNPPSPEFLALCDKLGFLVIDEAFDKWKSGYYSTYFDQWWQKDLDAMLRRDRNHPSIVMWSVGNEVGEQGDTTGVGTSRAQMLVDYVHRTEPSRKVMVAIAPGNVSKRLYNTNGFNDALDIVGYNYQEPWYTSDKKSFPDRLIFGSEVFPYYRGRIGSLRDYFPKNPWYDVAGNDFVFGQFLWAGVDYLGESSGWPSKGWPTSPFDVCMFEKSRAAFHRAVWKENEPMVSIAVADQSLNIDPGKDRWSWPHLISHWTFPQYTGHVIEVQTITNCQQVELWVNGASLGRRNTAEFTNNTIVWHVPYKAGKIEAKGYNKDAEAAVFELNTAGQPSKIVLSPDREMIHSDGQDLSHVTVKLVDEKGVVVPNDDRQLTFEVTGSGKLIGLDNGDLRRDEAFKGSIRTTYFGKALAVIQSLRQQGDIILKVSTKGLPAAELTIKSK